VFFVVFFNVYQGVKEASTTLLDNARMLGMSERQLLRHVYWPSALSVGCFHRCIRRSGFAVVGAVVGEYLGSAAGLGLSDPAGRRACSTSPVVFAGMIVLAMFRGRDRFAGDQGREPPGWSGARMRGERGKLDGFWDPSFPNEKPLAILTKQVFAQTPHICLGICA